MKHSFLKLFLISLAIFIFIFFPIKEVWADGLVPCGNGDNLSNACTLCYFIIGIKKLIDYGSVILITLTVLAIFIAGVVYIVSSGNSTLMTSAKTFLTNSLIGFTFVLTAWFIVNTVMWVLSAKPGMGVQKTNWYTFSCYTQSSIYGTGTTEGIPAAGQEKYSENVLTDAQAREKLTAAGIGIHSSGNCSDPNNPTCTSLEGLPAKTVADLIAVKQKCGSIAITGGTETGHQSHGYGKPVVDLGWNTSLASCLKNNYSSLNIAMICTTDSDQAYRVMCNFSEDSEHLHVVFN